MFEEEVRDKKRTASGVHSRTGKRGYVGQMRMPSDIMSRKDKYNYRKAGKVFIYNMYENIMPLKEFKALPLEERKKAMVEYQRRHTNASIMKTWGMDTYQFYTKLLIKELGLREDASKKKKRPKDNKKETPVEAYLVQEEVKPAPAVPEEPEDGFAFRFRGTFNAEQITKKLDKVSLILDGEESDFELVLTIKEKN